MHLTTNNDYQEWVSALKNQVRASQQKASLAVNASLIRLYWSIGKSILDHQEKLGWGGKVVEQLANDLKIETELPFYHPLVDLPDSQVVIK